MSLSTLLIILWALIVSSNENFCPSKCICRKFSQRNEIKVRCGEKGQIRSLDELDFYNIANEIVQLNLSNNVLESFTPKVSMIILQKLDLSGNKLTVLQSGQFSETPNLRRLDLSNNQIRSVDGLAFNKLTNLEKLKLNQNQITTISLGTFTPLISLKQLDISNNPLNCDCSLLWLLDWSQKQSVKLVANPTCNSPPSFRGLLLRKLRVGVDIHCKSPAFPFLSLHPSANQLVFEGDSLKVECVAASVSDFESHLTTKLQWTYLDSDPKLIFDDIDVEEGFVQSSGLISSTLRFSRLNRNHTGIWSCLLLSLQGNYSKQLTIIVISEETEYCPIIATTNNKGGYLWPRTIVNYTATLPCESANVNLDLSAQKATYFCSDGGRWMDLNTSMCSYTSETTKIFEQFSKVNSSIVESAKHFRNYTTNLRHFKHVMDVVFAVETMENYLRFLTVNQIGGVLMDVINNMMGLPKGLLRDAEKLDGSCSKLVNLTEVLAGVSTTSLLHKPNVAVEIFPIKPHSFANLKCTWYTSPTVLSDHQFYCVADSDPELTELPNKIIQASVTIPETLFENQKIQPDKIYNILITMYSSNKFFPIDHQANVDILSPIVGVKLLDLQLVNFTDPIQITLKRAENLATPVWWDSDSKTWREDGCVFSHDYNDYIGFVCYHFGYYGLLEDLNEDESYRGAKFKLSHPAIYVGSLILFLSFLFMILTYLFAYQAIQMPKKAKHCMINLWITISLLCFFYVFGIYQTEDVAICQSVGMLLHYFTLSALLWICVGVNCMYKRLTKNDIIELQNDDLPLEEPVKKPILGLYFVGWGVATIVCGISGAINIRDYASQTYCFLKLGPPISALYIPALILILFITIFFLLIKCSIYNIDPNGHLSEGTQATENVDLDLLEPNFPETRSVLTSSSTSSELEDQEHSPSAQLKSFVIFLILFILLWISCALATIETHSFLYQNEICSVSYAIFATVLSAFNVFFFGVARSDVRREWLQFSRCLRTKQFGCRSRNVSDTAPNLSHVVPAVNPDLAASRSSSRSSKSTVSKVDSKSNNVNLIVLHRQQYRTSIIPNIIENPTSAEVFYNPHQSIVARKFFKRQKRHMLKRNNLVTQKLDDSNLDLFATSSKVNNANIHVESAKKQHKNPNIFSDNSDYESNIEKLVLNAERLRKRKKKSSEENNMRSVSQQCTLEYSSENISDSILDKSPDSVPRVILNPTEEFLKSVQTNSVSSDLDDLYQQIKGPTTNSPFSDLELRNKLSDAETTV